MNLMIFVFISLWHKHVSGRGYQIKPHLEENSGTADYCFVGSTYQSFDSTIEFCCEGSIKSKVTVEEPCCTKVLDDGTVTTCCNGRYITLSNLKIAVCCGDFLFNKDVEFCYNGTVYPSNEGPSSTSITPTAVFENNHSDESGYEVLVYIIICGSITVILCLSLAITYMCCATRKSSRCKNTYCKITTGSTASNLSHKPCAENSMELTLLNENRFLKHNWIDSVKSQKENSQRSNTMSALHNDTIAGNTLFEEMETDGFVNQQPGDDLPYVRTAGYPACQNLPKTNTLKNDVMLIENDKGTQTDTDKTSNVTNVMGRKFDRRHVFDKKDTRLELPNSAVSLTISEDDIADGPVECYASTYRNLKEIYEIFGKYMTECEGIVSPTIEYMFPRNKRLGKFAYVDMKYYKCGCDGVLRVWRFDCENETELLRISVPNKNDVDPKHESVDAYYDILDPGFIRIYLKCFCTLMCTVCHGQHESFSLAAYMYFVPMPNDAFRHVRVSVYILDGVGQLQDYAQFVRADEVGIIPLKKKITLPMHVTLEDNLRIRLMLWPESRHEWQQRVDTEYPNSDCLQIVQLHNITQCHIHRSETLPYSSEWHFFGIGNPNILIVKKLIFNCDIDIAIVQQHPGVDTRPPPPNKFVLTHEVEFPTTKKTFQRDPLRGPIQQPANSTGHWNDLHGPIQQPAISTSAGSTATEGNGDPLPNPDVSSNHQVNYLGARRKQCNYNQEGINTIIEGQNRSPERAILPSGMAESSGDEDVRAEL